MPWVHGRLGLVRVLLLEDDDILRADVAGLLRARGVAVDEARRLTDVEERLTLHQYDAAVFDRRVPDGDSADLLALWRGRGLELPVLFLSGMDRVTDRVQGLDRGGDDYLVKPFAVEELLARVRALVRRGSRAETATLQLADLTVDLAAARVSRAGRPIALTSRQLSVLSHLLRHQGRTVSRAELLEHCWDEFADPVSNLVDVHVHRLRVKLGDPPLVHTVRGRGYLASDCAPDLATADAR